MRNRLIRSNRDSDSVITSNHTQECLSLAFVHALTGVAGVNLQLGRRHDYGIDGTFRPVSTYGSHHVENGFPVDFQLKSTVNWAIDDQDVAYDLDATTYNHLVSRDPSGVPCILILLCLPKEPSEWLLGSESEMLLRNCCYWNQLQWETTKNTTTKRIRIPRRNLLSVEAVRSILEAERAKRISS